MGALTGVTVLDITHVLSGPFCTYQLALLGADVLKIEDPRDPDCSRGRGPDADANAEGLGLNFQVQGGNKRAIALNLQDDAGRNILRRLASTADVLVENFSTGALTRLGLAYDDLSEINPCLIYCSITGYGDTGPEASTGAYDNVIQAASGTIAQCGGIKAGVSFIDYATGYAAAFAVTSALTPFVWVTPDWRGLLLGLGTGVTGGLAQYLTIEALHHERASVLAPYFYCSLIGSVLFGYALFDDLPDVWTYAGAATIIAGGLYTLHRERSRG